jgi:hypothetical protein
LKGKKGEGSTEKEEGIMVPFLGRIGIRFALVILAGMLVPLLYPLPLPAREDSARLVFQKTAGLPKTRIHVVKKGEWIASILRDELGDEPIPYALIRKLNPGIRNLNRIYPGQRIRLPIREKTESAEPASATSERKTLPMATYRIRNGDSISRIILGELGVLPEEALSTYRLIRQLNPEMEDLAQLQTGQILHLPLGLASRNAQASQPPLTETRSVEKAPDKTTAKAPPTTEGPLGIIRPVISRMKGTLTDKGNYFIPLRGGLQITIDCFLIPVVELDDGTTVFLDFGNRLSEDLKGVIRGSWPNYAFLPAEGLRDDLAALERVVNSSRKYRMVKADRPLPLIPKPDIQLFPDWLIAAKETPGAVPYRQGIFLLAGDERPFPPDVRIFAEKNGVILTEISEGREAPSPVSLPATPPNIPDLSGMKGVALAERLLTTIGETPVRSAEVVIFDQARNGFNLSIMADLLVSKGEKRFILHTKKLPEQFVLVLKEAGTEVISIGETDRGRPLVEGVLQGLNIPVSFGYFSFMIPEDGKKPRLTVTFPALKAITGGEPFYLIDFDMPPEAVSLLRSAKGVRVVRY